MAITTNLVAPVPNTQYIAQSGNQYTSNSAGLISGVTTGDVGSLLNMGCKTFPAEAIIVVPAGLTLTQAAHAEATLLLTAVAGQALVLPQATGSGAKYRLMIGASITSNSSTIKVPDANHIIVGSADQTGATGASTAFGTVDTGTISTCSDTVTLNGSTTGGLRGDLIEFQDIAVGQFFVNITGKITGTAATPFSITV